MKKMLLIIKEIFNKFPATYISSILFSFAYIFMYKNFNTPFVAVASFLVMFGSTSLLIESKFDNEKRKKYYVIPIILGIAFSVLTRIKSIYMSDLFIRISIFYLFTVFITSIYFNYKNTKKTLSKYITSCFSNFIGVGIIYSVLNVGFILIFTLIDYLIVDGALTKNIDKVLVFLFGTFLVPASIYSIDRYNDPNKLINTLVSKILFGLVITAYLIVYIYIFKIVITLNMPSNIVFRILSILFVLGHTINIMGMDIETNKTLKKVHNILPYVFIPFIFLQSYSLGLRLYSNDLTITRYFGIALIIFEIIYTVTYFKKKNECILVIALIIEMFILLVVPFINCFDLSIKSQYNNILKYKETNKVTEKAKGSFEYLQQSKKGRNLIDKTLSTEQKQQLSNIDDSEKHPTYYYYDENNKMDVAGYKTIELLEEMSPNNTKFEIVSKRAKSCVMGNKKDCFDNNNEIVLEKHKIIVKSVSIYKESNDSYYYNVEYYVLSK